MQGAPPADLPTNWLSVLPESVAKFPLPSLARPLVADTQQLLLLANPKFIIGNSQRRFYDASTSFRTIVSEQFAYTQPEFKICLAKKNENLELRYTFSKFEVCLAS